MAENRRVLIVEDNRDAARMLSLLLQMDGHQVCAAHSGLQALETARTFEPEVILLDIGLPDMSGYEVARQLRSEPQFDQALLVALTGHGSDQDRQRTREAGFDEHVVKPPPLPDLQALFTHPKLLG